MAQCKFTIDFDGGTQQVIDKARGEIEKSRGIFSGDTRTGTFTVPLPMGKIEGTYTISEHTMEVLITKKPFVIPCSTVESKLREYLERPGGAIV